MFADFKTNKKRLYWYSQIAGWGAYILLYSFAILTYGKFSWNTFLSYSSVGVFGIALTHLFRHYIIKWRWLDEEFTKVVWKLLLATALLSITMAIIIYGMKFAMGNFDEVTFRIGMPILFSLNMGILFLLWIIIYFAIHYFQVYQQTEIERYIWEAAVKDFELKTLKSQLNPHFMFNALNSIRALIVEDPERAKSAITKLSNIFRYSLKIERSETVPLGEEANVVDDYLSLEHIRYEERLRYTLNIPKNTENIEVPPMMIQTLVENGIKHGLSKFAEGGEIEVTAKRKENILHINIKNSGSISEDAVLNATGHGISNTKQRLHLLYGENASFTIANKNGFVEASIIMPTGGKNYESLTN